MTGGKKSRAGAFSGVRLRPAPKGRVLEPQAQADVADLLGSEPRRRDLLIEHLHKLQDQFGHLSAAHLNALAAEMRLTPAEVFEVASFYHHFDIVKENQTPPAPLTVRVCESIACHLGGGPELLHQLQEQLGPDVRVLPAPCVGQCDSAPVAVVGRNPLLQTDVDAVVDAVRAAAREPKLPEYIGYDGYRA